MTKLAFVVCLCVVASAAVAAPEKPKAKKTPVIGWNHPPTAAMPVNTKHQTFMSPSMKTAVGYNIYLPPEYEANAARRFPVIYALHGRGGTENSFLSNVELFDKAIREKQIPPAIYVMACGEANAGYVDSPDGSIRSDTAVVHELIPHIDKAYRTIADRTGRSVEGFSMGGQGALLFAFKYPEMFESVGGYGAGLANGVELQKELPEVFQKMHDNSIEQFDATSAWHYIVANADKIRGHVAIRMALGDGDQHLARNHHMKAVLDELKIPCDYEELPGVGHNSKLVYQTLGVKGWQFELGHLDAVSKK